MTSRRFVDLFAKCPESKENFLSLYNALHVTSLPLKQVLELQKEEKLVKV